MSGAKSSASVLERVGLPTLTVAAFVALWWGLVVWSGTRVFPAPAEVLAGLVEIHRSGLLIGYALDSLGRVFAGFGLAVVVAVPLGTLLGLRPALAAPLNPVLQFLRPISPLAWVPLVILAVGVGNPAGVALIFMTAFFSLIITTTHAVVSTPPMFLQAGRNFGMTGARLFWKVLLPASLPTVLTGFRIALWNCWQVVVAAEMVAVNSGLGYLIIDARNAGKRYDLVIAGMLLIGLIGLVLDGLFRWLETLRFVRWGFREG